MGVDRWRGRGIGDGAYIPEIRMIRTPSNTPTPLEGDTFSVNVYKFPIIFWIDNIPIFQTIIPTELWDRLLWIPECKNSLVLEGAIPSHTLPSFGCSAPPPTWGRHIFCKSIFSYKLCPFPRAKIPWCAWDNIPTNSPKVCTRSLNLGPQNAKTPLCGRGIPPLAPSPARLLHSLALPPPPPRCKILATPVHKMLCYVEEQKQTNE